MNYRNRKLLDAANGAPCQMCGAQDGTVVAAHANDSRFGKGAGLKAHDWAVAFLCHGCHAWIDQGNAPRDEKREAWMVAALKTWGWLVSTGSVEVAK